MDRESIPENIKTIAEEKIIYLDVRPILSAGGEPFSAIMDAADRTPQDGALRLRAPFKPTPLFAVFQGKGWSHWIEYGKGDDWMIWFHRASELQDALSQVKKEFPELEQRLKVREGGGLVLDVRRLSPPEPMELTLTVLENLPSVTSLLQINERVPHFLLPILDERGFTYTIDATGADVLVEIRKL